MPSLYEISGSLVESEFQNFYNSFYNDVLYFLERVNQSTDTIQFLNSINATTLDNLFTKAFRNLSNDLEKSLNKIFYHALDIQKFEPEIKKKYRNKIISNEEIYNFLDSNCHNLWQELQSWNENHQLFVKYHNESGDNAFDAGYGAGSIGGTIGSIFGPIGTVVGAALGGYLASTSVENEYESNFKLLMSHYESLLKEFDNTWNLICNNLLTNIFVEIDARYEDIQEEDNKIKQEKEAKKNFQKKDTTISYLPLQNSELKQNINNEHRTNNSNQALLYFLASALIFMTIFVILILTKVIHLG